MAIIDIYWQLLSLKILSSTQLKLQHPIMFGSLQKFSNEEGF